MFHPRKAAMALLAAATIIGSVAATTTSAEARWGHGGWRGGGFGIGAGVATGLALGALGGGYAYGGYPYYGPGYAAYGYGGGYYGGDCVIRRRVHYGPFGPVVRHVRVCY
jgi:hypothetical protein